MRTLYGTNEKKPASGASPTVRAYKLTIKGKH